MVFNTKLENHIKNVFANVKVRLRFVPSVVVVLESKGGRYSQAYLHIIAGPLPP